jgi:quercetin dioxygenase-like cupin family protein
LVAGIAAKNTVRTFVRYIADDKPREEEHMAAYAVKKIDEMEASFRGSFKRARAELGVESFGFQVMDFPPNARAYPEHDHAGDGQEEVYVALSGSGEIEIDGEHHRLDSETMVRVGPGVKRRIWTDEEPMRLLAIGGVPGKPYEPPENSKLGAPDPWRDGIPAS